MALYLMEEEEAWKCPKHPSKKRRSGVCPACLRHRLGILCPNCANSRPCSCLSNTASSSSSSSSSFFTSSGGEPSLRRSRSAAVTFLRSGSLLVKTPLLSALKKSGTKKTKENEELIISDYSNTDENPESKNRIEDFSRMITRSRSVSTTTTTSRFRRADMGLPAKWKLWKFPSPIKVFRTARVMVQDRSPLHRG
ncbi:hypothetical protein F511_07528 [Dorcoceras hygrometricum]|uniref:Uncharacterized protein n=1 Tax=Dorcoceras hygrometricum TaxID=472368 RepID=A0A2Z7B4T9_9LAMI|nr:hypothetical protein F511_07528 [Dorcoceras hygrometricum]